MLKLRTRQVGGKTVADKIPKVKLENSDLTRQLMVMVTNTFLQTVYESEYDIAVENVTIMWRVTWPKIDLLPLMEN